MCNYMEQESIYFSVQKKKLNRNPKGIHWGSCRGKDNNFSFSAQGNVLVLYICYRDVLERKVMMGKHIQLIMCLRYDTVHVTKLCSA